MNERSGGRLVVEALVANGVDTVFCVPGESFLAVLDALHDVPAVRIVTCRHEASAATMAEADGKLTGRPGICFVTRGPGATHGSIGVHTAMQDSTPLILFVGQVARGMRGREAFQEIDYRAMFGGLAKWVCEIDDARRIPELVGRAFRVALSGRPGPVVIALPEDMLRERVAAAEPGVATASGAHPGAEDLAALARLLGEAERPLVILGGSGWDADASAAVQRIAARALLPVACSFRRQALFDNRHPCYVGDVGLGIDPRLAERIRGADLILALGGRLGEVPTSGYTLIEAPRPRQRLVHVHADPGELGRVFEPVLAINARPAHFVRALDALAVDGVRWSGWTRAARADYEAKLRPAPSERAIDLPAVVRHLSARLPEDAIVCNGAGNFAAALHRYFEYKRYGTQLAPTSGAMAYGLPAGIAAKLRHPERVVVVWAGDGDFTMSAHELATAMQYGAAVVVVIVNNGMLGTIRMHQERAYPGRVTATELRNPDFVALAAAYGAFGTAVERTDAFPAALDAALGAGRAAIVDLRTGPVW